MAGSREKKSALPTLVGRKTDFGGPSCLFHCGRCALAHDLGPEGRLFAKSGAQATSRANSLSARRGGQHGFGDQLLGRPSVIAWRVAPSWTFNLRARECTDICVAYTECDYFRSRLTLRLLIEFYTERNIRATHCVSRVLSRLRLVAEGIF